MQENKTPRKEYEWGIFRYKITENEEETKIEYMGFSKDRQLITPFSTVKVAPDEIMPLDKRIEIIANITRNYLEEMKHLKEREG